MNMHTAPQPGGRARPLVLIVDDVFENRSSLQRRLERSGYDCLVADSGRATLDLLLTTRPQIILLDYMMPEMSGLSVLKEIRASKDHGATPVIMLTARTDSEAVVASLEAGADDYVHKPIDFAALKARIEAHLERSQTTKALIDANVRMDGWAAARAVELSEVRDMLHSEIARTHELEQRHWREDMESGSELTAIARHLSRIVALADGGEGASVGARLAEIRENATAAVDRLSKVRLSILN